MIERIPGIITAFDGSRLTAEADYSNDRKLMKQSISECEIILRDGRSISPEQRRKAYATIRDIADYSGDVPEAVKEFLKWEFCAENGIEAFSLGDCDMTIAREFISYMLELVIQWGIPMRQSGIDRTDDIGKYLYMCLEHRKCAICGLKADIHHVDRVGMGRDRAEIVHEGMRAMSLCRIHHTECHDMGQTAFDKKYHIYGIALDKWLCDIIGLAKAE